MIEKILNYFVSEQGGGRAVKRRRRGHRTALRGFLFSFESMMNPYSPERGNFFAQNRKGEEPWAA
jgi:hypothetical protein